MALKLAEPSCAIFKWKGSLFKLLYKELLAFIVAYVIVSVVYRHVGLEEEQKRNFELLVTYCRRYLDMIPLSFILGFYLTIIATRWWTQCTTLPWPDRIMLAVACYIPGADEESRLLRKTLCSCSNLMAVLLFRSISDAVSSRLKTLQDVVDAGFMTKEEKEIFESVKADIAIWWLPALWFSHYLREAQKQGKIAYNDGARLIMAELLEFRSKCGSLWLFDWRTIPLVYTQVVTFATYTFYAACIIGRQYIEGTKEIPFDAYVPIWTILQLLVYLGLLKVADNMVNPYGDDDEDFDLNWLINRHNKAIHLGTDALCSQLPKMTRTLSKNPVASPALSHCSVQSDQQLFTPFNTPSLPSKRRGKKTTFNLMDSDKYPPSPYLGASRYSSSSPLFSEADMEYKSDYHRSDADEKTNGDSDTIFLSRL